MKAYKKKVALVFAMLLIACSSAAALHLVVTIATQDSARRHFAAWLKGAKYGGREGVLLQTNTVNCGPTALKMVLDSLGVERTLADIESAVTLDERGASLFDLMTYAKNQGLRAETWKLHVDDLADKPLPAVVFVYGDHFAVLDRITPQGEIHLRDPAIGRLRIDKADFANIWSGETLLIRK